MTHGEFAKYIVDKFGITSFERNLAGAECFGVPSDMYIASINLNPAKFDDFAHSIRIDEDGVKIENFEEITEDKVKEFIENNNLPVDDHFGVVSNGKPEHFKAFLKIIMGDKQE